MSWCSHQIPNWKGSYYTGNKKTGKGAHEKSRLPPAWVCFSECRYLGGEEDWVGFCGEGEEGMKAPAVKQVKSEVEGRISGISISVVVQAHCSRGWSWWCCDLQPSTIWLQNCDPQQEVADLELLFMRERTSYGKRGFSFVFVLFFCGAQLRPRWLPEPLSSNSCSPSWNKHSAREEGNNWLLRGCLTLLTLSPRGSINSLLGCVSTSRASWYQHSLLSLVIPPYRPPAVWSSCRRAVCVLFVVKYFSKSSVQSQVLFLVCKIHFGPICII